MSITNPTKAELAALLAQATAALAAATAGQHATPAAVAEAAAPVVEETAEPVVVETASDKLKAFVEAEGKQFARGGRTVWSLAALKTAVKVLQSGKPEIVSLDGIGSYSKRNVTGLAIGVADDGKSVLTQFVYTPQV